MKQRILSAWEALRSGFWFVPSIMAAAMALSFVLVALDHRVESSWVNAAGWVWGGSVDGARSVLSTTAGSIATVAGVVFSITLTSLTLASSQFGPRLLRTFMRDLSNQITLGTFIATFLYCLMVLRTVRSVEESRFVPSIAVTVGLLMAVLSIGVLIYFFHHAATSIQADTLCAAISRDIDGVTEKLYPHKIGAVQPDEPGELPSDFEQEVRAVPALCSGYVQGLDGDALLKLAARHNVVLRVNVRPGSFVGRGGTLVEIYPAKGFSSALSRQLQKVFSVGKQRTPEQDAEFAINQLVEIAVRALSSGLNDSRTAIVCMDWLGVSLARLAERQFPSPWRRDNQGQLRIVAVPVTLETLLNGVITPLRSHGAADTQAMMHLLHTTAIIGAPAQEETRTLLRHHAQLVAQDGQREAVNPEDQSAIEDALQRTLRVLSPTDGASC